MVLIKEIKESPLQTISLIIFLFTIYFFLAILGELKIGFYAYLAEKIFSILSHPLGIFLEGLGIHICFWDIWKKIPISIHILISFVYLFLIGMLFPISFHLFKKKYEKAE